MPEWDRMECVLSLGVQFWMSCSYLFSQFGLLSGKAPGTLLHPANALFQKRVNLFPSNGFNRCEKVSILCERRRKMPPSSAWENMKADLQSISPSWVPLKRMTPLRKHWLYLINATFTVSRRTLKLNQVLNRVRSRFIGGAWRFVAKFESNHVAPSHFFGSVGFKRTPVKCSAVCPPPQPCEMLRRHLCHVLLLWNGRKIAARDATVASCSALPCSKMDVLWNQC